jgi:hypothetical protein
MRMSVTALYGWGVVFGNWPGFETTAGPKHISYWAKRGSGTIPKVNVKVKWYDAARQLLQENDIPPLSLSSTEWRQGSADLTAPAGTASVHMEVTGPGNVGNVVFFDDFVVGDVTTTGSEPIKRRRRWGARRPGPSSFLATYQSSILIPLDKRRSNS